MSFIEWEEKFYPINAMEAIEDGSQLTAARHSLQKWLGLRELGEFDLKCFSGEVLEIDHGLGEYNPPWFSFGVSTCALCLLNPGCENCPLPEFMRDRTCRSDSSSAPYQHFLLTGDPEPMITALTELVQALEKDVQNNES